MDNLYNKINALCKANKTTVSGMCRDLEISRSTLSELKSGRTQKLSVDNMNKIANYFGTTVDRLISDELYETKPDREALREAFEDRHIEHVNNDPELAEYLEMLRTRPELKMMFQLAKGATKQDVEKAVKIIEALLKD